MNLGSTRDQDYLLSWSTCWALACNLKSLTLELGGRQIESGNVPPLSFNYCDIYPQIGNGSEGPYKYIFFLSITSRGLN